MSTRIGLDRYQLLINNVTAHKQTVNEKYFSKIFSSLKNKNVTLFVESTALELARCEGTRARSAVPSVLLAALLSAVLAARNG